MGLQGTEQIDMEKMNDAEGDKMHPVGQNKKQSKLIISLSKW